tara:strand:+ start:158 stop:496 length:339 start_codon:yes stop_codon:yes gene_type:complete
MKTTTTNPFRFMPKHEYLPIILKLCETILRLDPAITEIKRTDVSRLWATRPDAPNAGHAMTEGMRLFGLIYGFTLFKGEGRTYLLRNDIVKLNKKDLTSDTIGSTIESYQNI